MKLTVAKLPTGEPRKSDRGFLLSNPFIFHDKHSNTYSIGTAELSPTDTNQYPIYSRIMSKDNADDLCMTLKHDNERVSHELFSLGENIRIKETQLVGNTAAVYTFIDCDKKNNTNESVKRMKKLKITEGQLARVVKLIKEGEIRDNMVDKSFDKVLQDTTKTPEELLRYLNANFYHPHHWLQIFGDKMKPNFGTNWLSQNGVRDSYTFLKKLADGSITPEMVDQSGITNVDGQKFSDLPMVQDLMNSETLRRIRGEQQPEPEGPRREMGIDPALDEISQNGQMFKNVASKEGMKSSQFNFENAPEPAKKVEFPFSLKEFAEEVKQFLLSLVDGGKPTISLTLFKQLGLSRDEFLDLTTKNNITSDRDGKIEINAEKFPNIKGNIRRLYNELKDGVNKPSKVREIAPQAAEQPQIEANLEYKTKYMNKELAILKNKTGELFMFYYGKLGKEDLVPQSTGSDLNYDSFEINDLAINNYVNKNAEALTENNELVKVDQELAGFLVKDTGSEKLAKVLGVSAPLQEDGEGGGAMGGGAMGAPATSASFGATDQGPTTTSKVGGQYVAPLTMIKKKMPVTGEPVQEGKKQAKKDGNPIKSLKEKYNYRPAKSKTRRCKECEHYVHGGTCEIMRSGKLRGRIDPNHDCDAFEKEQIDEMDMSTPNPSGSYEQPKIWAKGKCRLCKDPMYPGGKILEALRSLAENFQTDPTYKDGGKFVEFDDCTKLNNNKEAQNGGCGVGDDGVVKYKDSKKKANS